MTYLHIGDMNQKQDFRSHRYRTFSSPSPQLLSPYQTWLERCDKHPSIHLLIHPHVRQRSRWWLTETSLGAHRTTNTLTSPLFPPQLPPADYPQKFSQPAGDQTAAFWSATVSHKLLPNNFFLRLNQFFLIYSFFDFLSEQSSRWGDLKIRLEVLF